MVARAGIEPAHGGIKTRCLTIWRPGSNRCYKTENEFYSNFIGAREPVWRNCRSGLAGAGVERKRPRRSLWWPRWNPTRRTGRWSDSESWSSFRPAMPLRTCRSTAFGCAQPVTESNRVSHLTSANERELNPPDRCVADSNASL